MPKLVIEEDSIHWPDIKKPAKLPNFTFYGIFMVVLGVITLVVTYKYVVPTGSIFLIAGGLFLIFVRLKEKEVKQIWAK